MSYKHKSQQRLFEKKTTAIQGVGAIDDPAVFDDDHAVAGSGGGRHPLQVLPTALADGAWNERLFKCILTLKNISVGRFTSDY